MKRIFLTLALLANITLMVAFVMGWQVGDPATLNGRDPDVNDRIGTHLLVGLGALTSATMVHALLLTYFMGTGRWIEETSQAYRLSSEWYRQNQRTKYGILPGILGSFLMLVVTGSLGAVADPATVLSLERTLGINDSTLHFAAAVCTWIVNLIVNMTQYLAITKNSAIVEGVLAEVRRIRIEKGLPVD
ncbi:MAG: hypothetical protein DWI29_03935 [Planctomycetota bacterium]|nr:MAG: hypothetical protein DWI29_03935 [Planctomycetota bacterium]